jgi:hypothetical protein
VLSPCAGCRHFGGRSLPVRAAFPGWIPQPILSNKVDHRLPADGDQGVRFEPRPDLPSASLARLFRVLDATPGA